MIYYLKGIIQELKPAYTIIEVSGIGYYVGISLQTSQKLKVGEPATLHTQQIIREDANLLYGFYTTRERETFNLLISVNGVGAVSALILLSTLEIPEIAQAIVNRQSPILQRAKGIGAKTAERIIVDLKDKVQIFAEGMEEIPGGADNNIRNEALTALEVLGIPRRTAEKAANKILKGQPDIDVETLVKTILKNL